MVQICCERIALIKSRYPDSASSRQQKHLKITRASNESGAFSSKGREQGWCGGFPEGLEVFTYTDQKGHQVHALATVKAEKEFVKEIPSKLLPLYLRMEQALARTVGRS